MMETNSDYLYVMQEVYFFGLRLRELVIVAIGLFGACLEFFFLQTYFFLVLTSLFFVLFARILSGGDHLYHFLKDMVMYYILYRQEL